MYNNPWKGNFTMTQSVRPSSVGWFVGRSDCLSLPIRALVEISNLKPVGQKSTHTYTAFFRASVTTAGSQATCAQQPAPVGTSPAARSASAMGIATAPSRASASSPASTEHRCRPNKCYNNLLLKYVQHELIIKFPGTFIPNETNQGGAL